MTQIVIVVVVALIAAFLVRRSMVNKKLAAENKVKGAEFLAENNMS